MFVEKKQVEICWKSQYSNHTDFSMIVSLKFCSGIKMYSFSTAECLTFNYIASKLDIILSSIKYTIIVLLTYLMTSHEMNYIVFE